MSVEVQYDYSKLRGRIREVLGTEGLFAEKLSRSQNFLTKVFNGESFFSQKDIETGTDVLNIPVQEIGTYFFTKKVHKNETS